MNKQVKIKTLVALTFLASISTVSAKTISATATGEQYPDMVIAPASIANGDFFITDRGENRNVGDGNNEVTNWELDYRHNFGGNVKKMRTFLKSKKTLCSAVLSLKMHPGSSNGMRGDVIGIVGLRPIGKGLPFRQNWADTSLEQNIQFDLLSRYSAKEINSSLFSYPLGAIQMRYYDDALISKASLTLNYSDTGSCSNELVATEKLQATGTGDQF